jgi:hypothetical protein
MFLYLLNKQINNMKDLNNYTEQIADLANYIKCNDITINNENDLQLAMRNWLQDGMKFYHRMTKTKDGIIVAEKMFNNYINKLND